VIPAVGLLITRAIPSVAEIPTRKPVKLPGPIVDVIKSISLYEKLFCSNNSFIRVINVSACLFGCALIFAPTSFPSLTRAQEQPVNAVSTARINMIYLHKLVILL